MKAAVRYVTRSGNTKKLAEAIADAVGAEALDLSHPLEEKADLLFLGTSVYAGGVDESVGHFLAANKDQIGTVCNFSTAAMGKSSWKAVSRLTEANGVKLAEGFFHCLGRFGILHRNRPNAADLQAAAVFAKKCLKEQGA